MSGLQMFCFQSHNQGPLNKTLQSADYRCVIVPLNELLRFQFSLTLLLIFIFTKLSLATALEIEDAVGGFK